jgi:hypothetical protein
MVFAGQEIGGPVSWRSANSAAAGDTRHGIEAPPPCVQAISTTRQDGVQLEQRGGMKGIRTEQSVGPKIEGSTKQARRVLAIALGHGSTI